MGATPTTNHLNNGKQNRPRQIAQLLAAEEIGIALMARVETDLADEP